MTDLWSEGWKVSLTPGTAYNLLVKDLSWEVGHTDLKSLQQRKELSTTFQLPAAAFPLQAWAGRVGWGGVRNTHIHPPTSSSAKWVNFHWCHSNLEWHTWFKMSCSHEQKGSWVRKGSLGYCSVLPWPLFWEGGQSLVTFWGKPQWWYLPKQNPNVISPVVLLKNWGDLLLGFIW